MTLTQKVIRRIQTTSTSLKNDWQTLRLARSVARRASEDQFLRPVVFFNASTRLRGLSLNAAFSLLTSWVFRLSGRPVVHFVCKKGMSHCVLGTDETNLARPMACGICIHQSRTNFTGAQVRYFTFKPDESLTVAIKNFNLDELMHYEHPMLDASGVFPIGNIVLPSLRWRLRLKSLIDDEPTRYLYRQYILSAWNVAREFVALLDRTNPQVVFLFNGQFFPEATAAWIARRRGIRVVTHEVGFQPFSGFFTEGEATAYPIHIPDDFDLDEAQNARLDAYLVKRFHGEFSMAGIRFWPDMKGLDEAFLQKTAGFKQIVPVFTNIIFDTSQPHANTVFTDMFAWLELVIELARLHSETLFVIRAHPDETRAGKESRETVEEWLTNNNATRLPNVVFVPPKEYFSSYELIQRSKFVMIYNSTIGLEATIMGRAVLCAGNVRFTKYPIVFFSHSVAEFRSQAELFLAAENIVVPEEFHRNARRFMYYQLYRTSLPFGEFLESTQPMGFVRLKKFSPAHFVQSPTARALLGGLFDGKRFELDV